MSPGLSQVFIGSIEDSDRFERIGKCHVLQNGDQYSTNEMSVQNKRYWLQPDESDIRPFSFIQLRYMFNDSSISMIFEVTPIQLHPINHSILDTQSVIFHPLVEEFLVLSALELESIELIEEACTIPTGPSAFITDSNYVQLHVAQVHTPSQATVISKMFQILSISDIIVVAADDKPILDSITLEFISSSDESHTQLFQSLFSSSFYPSRDSIDSSSSLSFQLVHNNQAYITSLLLSRLQGRLIQEHSCIALSIPWIFEPHGCDPWDESCVVFFYISSISSSNINSSSCYYIESAPSFELKIQNVDSSSMDPLELVQHNRQKNSRYSFTSCPGYEGLLNELISLSHLNSSAASPSGILLVGSHGVGKSRLVRDVLKIYSSMKRDTLV